MPRGVFDEKRKVVVENQIIVSSLPDAFTSIVVLFDETPPTGAYSKIITVTKDSILDSIFVKGANGQLLLEQFDTGVTLVDIDTSLNSETLVAITDINMAIEPTIDWNLDIPLTGTPRVWCLVRQ